MWIDLDQTEITATSNDKEDGDDAMGIACSACGIFAP